MIWVYVLRSLMDGSRYTGMAKNYKSRLADHNKGKNRYTKGHRPWEIEYFEHHPNWKEARTREKYLKSAAGRLWLEKFLRTNRI